MGWISSDKEEYISKWKPRDFKDLVWLPVIFIAFFFIEFKLKHISAHLALIIEPLIFGVMLVLCAKGLSILFNLDWIASPFGKPMCLVTPFRLRLVGAVIISICILTLILG